MSRCAMRFAVVLNILFLLSLSVCGFFPSNPQEGESEDEKGEGEGGQAPGTEATVMLPGDVPLQMVWLPAVTFMMSRYTGEHDSDSWEDPQHPQRVGRAPPDGVVGLKRRRRVI